MSCELDHVFVCASVEAPEADLLVEFGLTEGRERAHSGQGTANRCFFFANAMLELIWVHDAPEAGSQLTRPTRLLERWQGRHGEASPFGICLRPARPHGGEIPFSGWAYKPSYLSTSAVIHVANNSTALHEPMLFYLPFGHRPDMSDRPQPLEHAAGFREITAVRVTSPLARAASEELLSAERTGAMILVEGSEHLMEIGYDGERTGRCADFRPHLPLKTELVTSPEEVRRDDA